MCGFAGSWLAEELLGQGYIVRGSALPGESDANVGHLGRRLKIDLLDITDGTSCREVFNRFRPDYIFHLAALASVGQSFSHGNETFRVNVTGTHNVFEAAVGKSWLNRVIYISSSDVYGPVGRDDLPLRPNHPVNPISPYAQSKVAAEYLARIYIEQYRMPLVIVRPFNHAGPRQNEHFVIPAFCRKIAAAEKRRGTKVMPVGNVNVWRDISDVRDIVRGYRLIAEQGGLGETYHLCSGKAYKIGDLLNKLISFSDIAIKTQKDRRLFRTTDIPVLRGSYHKTMKQIGWRPEISIVKTLTDTLEFWRTLS